MEKKKIVSLVMLVSAFAMSGCGRIYTGSYPGTATMIMNGVSLPASSVTVSLSQPTGETVTGTVSGAIGNGNLTGRASPTGAGIDNVMLTLTSTGTMGLSNPMYPSQYPGQYPQYPTTYPGQYPGAMTPGMPGAMPGMTSMCTTFMGSLSISPSKTLTGVLSAQAPCTGSITFNGQGY